MKLHRLELQGFGPFRERQVVDFDDFADDGIFLIAGRTGAGKSSVLDGVCYALFGGIPRYDTAERRLRSDHCAPDDPTEVALEFSAAGERWRVTRSPEYERPKRRGGGITKEPHCASLERREGERWVGVAARPVDVAAELDDIVGLTQQQFLQVILLAQNRFARFLLARNDERQALLRTLFGTRTYDDYERILDERRKEAERALAAEGESARMLLGEGEAVAREAAVDDADPVDPDDLTGRLAALVRAVERADYRVEVAAQNQIAAEIDADAASGRYREASTLHEKQVRRVDARTALERLDDAGPAIERDRARLALAAAAEAVRPALDAADRAAEAARSAAEAAAKARAEWLAAGETAVTAADLRARDDALATALAQAAEATDAESGLVSAETERDGAAAAAAAADDAIADLDARRAAVPALRAALDERVAALAPAPAMLEAARRRLDEVSQRRDAAREADALSRPRGDAEREAIAAATRLVEATAAHTALLQRRLDSAAGDLARDLVDGAECPVCGATEHPRPAHPSDDPVTDAAVDAAAREKDDALAADRAAAAAAVAAREAHAAAAARAAGQDLMTLEESVAAAMAALGAAEADVRTGESLVRERAALVALDAEAAAGREALVADAASKRQAAALAAQRADALRSRVVAARGSFASVAERLGHVERRRAMARALIEATADAALRTQVAADASADLAARLRASDFADVDATRDALLTASERKALDERVRAHDASRRVRTQTLLELELDLVDAADEPIDLAPLATEAAATRARLTEVAAARATATATAARLRDLAERADAAHRRIAEEAQRHAVVARLANTVAGRAPNTHRMTLETFVLAAELEEIVTSANVRLDEMSAGRYRLRHTDALAARGAASGLGLEVMDAFTGRARPPQSLSGGETFLASLSLALGLAEVVTARAGGMRLDTLFIDEGFGSLDDDTLDLAMRALDELRQGGRTVGVISHVAAMKEQIPAQLAVRTTPQGPSVIEQRAAVAV